MFLYVVVFVVLFVVLFVVVLEQRTSSCLVLLKLYSLAAAGSKCEIGNQNSIYEP